MKLCLTCRARLEDDEACAEDHEVVALDADGWRRVREAVWGDGGAAGSGRRAALAFAAQVSLLLGAVLVAITVVASAWVGDALWLGTGALWGIATILLGRRVLADRGVRLRRHPGAARGAVPRRPQRGATLRGVVVATGHVTSPLGDEAVAWSLSAERAGAVFLHDARTAGFAVRLGEGTLVEIPAGPVRLFGPRALARHPDARRRLARWLRPPRGPDPFPADELWQTLVADGAVVDVLADLDPASDTLRVRPPVELHLRPAP